MSNNGSDKFFLPHKAAGRAHRQIIGRLEKRKEEKKLKAALSSRMNALMRTFEKGRISDNMTSQLWMRTMSLLESSQTSQKMTNCEIFPRVEWTDCLLTTMVIMMEPHLLIGRPIRETRKRQQALPLTRLPTSRKLVPASQASSKKTMTLTSRLAFVINNLT